MYESEMLLQGRDDAQTIALLRDSVPDGDENSCEAFVIIRFVQNTKALITCCHVFNLFLSRISSNLPALPQP